MRKDWVISVRLPEELLRRLDEWAGGEYLGRSEAVRRLLRLALRRELDGGREAT